MNNYLLACSISPVQSFIEQARKTQDLYAGSFLLSHLCRLAAKKAQDEFGAQVIFPSYLDSGSIPNRFIASVTEGETPLDLKKIGECLEQSVHDRFSAITFEILASCGVDSPKGLREQIESFFSVNWVFHPYADGEYDVAYKEVECLLGAVKGIRAFRQRGGCSRVCESCVDTLTECGRKCSVCGERDVKFYRLSDNEKEQHVRRGKLFGRDAVVVGSREYGKIELKLLQHGEGLCGVCFTKRAFGKTEEEGFDPNFPSVSRIALYDTFAAYKNKTGNAFPQLEDEQVLFKVYENPRVSLTNMERQFPTLREEELTRIRQLVRELMEPEQERVAISPYYAVVVFDADDMGKWVSGRFRRIDEPLPELPIFQAKLAERLGDFAQWTKGHLVEPRGKTVYAGGDDFLGFVNLTYLLPTLLKLRNKFDDIVNTKELLDMAESGKKLTFSAGVAIAHFKTPLREVLGWARRMEHDAKHLSSAKDAFAIATLKHSGEIHSARFRWTCMGTRPLEVMEKVINKLRTGANSSNFIKALWGEFPRLIDRKGRFDSAIGGLVETEILRLLKRSRGNDEKIAKDEAEALATQLIALLTESESLTGFLSFLSIADFIARKTGGN